ncbi:MAG: glycerate kinase [Sedimentisphaerales bacterium]|jgi:glycerate kinase|nr:glycerate kinase [Sedimentisphaerales bacterium]HNY79487.1 glycerate kinase [Sedimentisphaerales bacterium]HOC64607.1 glycerate kinase [Sedimentisphaerales bacterium]HOH65400.1 glycerate kinase [Sedimentisphaerales bacterium]HPY50034.1 glycerate kinase [Sedimentisphaerales bacterium]
MKIVVAMDSFKGTLAAERACRIVADAIGRATPDAEIVVKPMADGGEGTAAALMAASNGQWIPVTVMGPLPQMQVAAGFAWLPGDRTAAVEMASASGMQLLRREQLNPLKTTTFGTGQLIRAALDRGAERILLGVGGSATVDGGVGAATALGWEFLAGDGTPVGLGAGALAEIVEIIPPDRDMDVPVDVLCDVDNPLCGPHGAARVYGPQKGATPQMVETLDSALAHMAELVSSQLGIHVRDLPGAGAAGGLAAGAVAFMEARLVSGIETVMAQSRLRREVSDADWVVTGEGCFDSQSMRGKVVSGVARVARQGGARVGVIAGQVLLANHVFRNVGIEAALACTQPGMDLQFALEHCEELLAQAAGRFATLHLGG